jgi:hypothetical protein
MFAAFPTTAKSRHFGYMTHNGAMLDQVSPPGCCFLLPLPLLLRLPPPLLLLLLLMPLLLLLLLFQSKDYLHEPDMFLLQCWLAAAAAATPAATSTAATAAATPAAAAAAAAVGLSHPSGGVAAAVATMLAAFGGLPLMQAAGRCGTRTSHTSQDFTWKDQFTWVPHIVDPCTWTQYTSGLELRPWS